MLTVPPRPPLVQILVCGSELFTGNTALCFAAVLEGKTKIGAMLKNWVGVAAPPARAPPPPCPPRPCRPPLRCPRAALPLWLPTCTRRGHHLSGSVAPRCAHALVRCSPHPAPAPQVCAYAGNFLGCALMVALFANTGLLPQLTRGAEALALYKTAAPFKEVRHAGGLGTPPPPRSTPRLRCPHRRVAAAARSSRHMLAVGP